MLLLVLRAIFQPLQGFLIFLSYRRPTYLRFRGKRNGCSRVQATREALRWDLEGKLNRGHYQHTSLKPYRRDEGERKTETQPKMAAKAKARKYYSYRSTGKHEYSRAKNLAHRGGLTKQAMMEQCGSFPKCNEWWGPEENEREWSMTWISQFPKPPWMTRTNSSTTEKRVRYIPFRVSCWRLFD